MTTKNYTKDDRWWQNNALGSPQQLGRFLEHIQSGGNYVRGQAPGTPHNYEMTHNEYVIGTYNAIVQSTIHDPLYNTFFSAGIPACTYDPINANEMNDIISKLGDKYSNHGFDLGVFTGELGELTDQTAGRVKQLALIVKNLKKGRFDKALSLLKKDAHGAQKFAALEKAAKNFNGKGRKSQRVQKRKLKAIQDLENGRISDLHLEIVYGILPSVSDIFEMSKAIQVAGQPRRKRISALVRHFVKPQQSGHFKVAASGFTLRSVIGYLEEEVPTLSQTLGLTDPKIWAWELLPFSFVLDWALPIGDWLSARQAASTMKGTFVTTDYTNYLCTITNEFSSSYVPNPAPPPTFVLTGLGTKGYRRYIYVKRTVSSSLSGMVKFPKFQIPITGPGLRLANAVALAASVLFAKK